ncbi:uncharacterized protein PpBr36_09674 [Pyricularia pennisetigena]|uniref:uncharacterized protein n=1 Tax=Pyricularia pennisetigena TaxID=1578925 RepID=UPI0011546EEE|nr:uncharacterized protein PpBr36_09674 [Pyricularia pennisetigena]TLS22308.1 hypothetical protein PpBr36_09674 [Pyricularia pennisetigena]
MLIRECSLCCSLETESLTPTGPSRDSAAHIALAATATMVERRPKDKLWAEKGADVRVKGSAGNPLKRSALGSLDTFPSRWEDYCAFFPSSRRRAAPHTRRNCRFSKVEDVNGRVVNLLGQFGYAWRRANLWSFFKWNPSSSSTVARSASSSRSRLCDNNTPAAAVTRLQKGLALFLRIICAVPRVEACDVVFLGVGPLGLFGRLRRLRLGGGVGRGLLAVVSCFVDSINSKE